jgi:hypothetical protein
VFTPATLPRHQCFRKPGRSCLWTTDLSRRPACPAQRDQTTRICLPWRAHTTSTRCIGSNRRSPSTPCEPVRLVPSRRSLGLAPATRPPVRAVRFVGAVIRGAIRRSLDGCVSDLHDAASWRSVADCARSCAGQNTGTAPCLRWWTIRASSPYVHRAELAPTPIQGEPRAATPAHRPSHASRLDPGERRPLSVRRRGSSVRPTDTSIK